MKIKRNFKSIKEFNKYRKRFFLCYDNFGNSIYPSDYVEVQIKHETNTSHCSVVYFDFLSGAKINSHPAHRNMNLSYYRKLSDFISDDESYTLKKITHDYYENWYLSIIN